MLAKVIPQQKRYITARALVSYALSLDEQQAEALAQDLPPDAAALVQYAAREGVESAGVSPALAALGIRDPLAEQPAVTRALDRIVQRVRERGVAAEQPLYHVVVTWQPGERPSDAQAQAAADHVLRALDMQAAAAFYVVHRDKEHHHIHLVACKYHPDTFEYLGPPKRDFLALDRAMRELELAQGWAHSPGPHQVINGEIVLLSRRERARGRDLSAERAEGVPGILGYAEHHRLRRTLEAAKNWQQVHADVQALGLELTPKGGGLVLSGTDAQGRKRAVKLSDLGIRSGAWQAQLGPYQPPAARVEARVTLASWQRDVMRGRVPELESPRTTKRDPIKRAAQREARAKAREALYERYREHVQQLPCARRAALEALKVRQKAERVALLQSSRDARAQQFQTLAAAHGAEVARQMLDGQIVAALAALKKRHQAERQAVLKQHSPSWREFLEMRARLYNDPAAISALRGIAYREKRKQHEKSPGFEGEDLRADPHSTQEWAGGIEGELRQWTLADAVAEVSRDGTTITYRDRDGRERIRDQGQRIDVVRGLADEDATEAALLLAAQRYGGEVFITGDETFREHAARLAARRGIAVANIELQRVWQEERSRMEKRGVDITQNNPKITPSQPAKETYHER